MHLFLLREEILPKICLIHLSSGMPRHQSDFLLHDLQLILMLRLLPFHFLMPGLQLFLMLSFRDGASGHLKGAAKQFTRGMVPPFQRTSGQGQRCTV